MRQSPVNRLADYLRAFRLALPLMLGASTTGAHALLVESEPGDQTTISSPPSKIAARYSQELDTRLSSLRVFDPQGRQVDNGDGRVDLIDPDHAWLVATLPPELAAGTYTVRWTVVSAEDGDPTEGEFRFNIGQATSVAAGSNAAVRTWAAAGFALVVGTAWLLRNRRRRQRQS